MQISKFCKRHQIAVTSRKVVSYGMILSFHWNLFYGRGYHDLSVTCIVILYCKICTSMRPFERYKLNVYHVMENCVLVEIHKKTFYGL